MPVSGVIGVTMGDDCPAHSVNRVDVGINVPYIKLMVQKAHNKEDGSVSQSIPDFLRDHPLTGWIEDKGWAWFDHQIETLHAAREGKDLILFAPTGAGKTLAGFLPSLVDLHENGSGKGLHTLYISPLKALAVDVQRNIGKPAEDLDLPFTYETRTGDTPQSRRKRQRDKPPDILMTTPESLALMLSYDASDRYFKHLRHIIIDEIHAFLHTKRADLLSLNLERLRTFAPKASRIGLSATLADKKTAKDWVCRRGGKIISVPQDTKPEIEILQSDNHIPWSGHSASYAIEDMYRHIKQARMSVVFVNTRAQAEFVFQNLWRANDDNLKIGLHHGSLEKELRRKVEAHMASGDLNCVVATSSLDLGLDWADVDLVVQVGAPKGISRLLQRIGRANHRMNKPSRALLVPTNRLEYIECRAAIQEIDKYNLDGVSPKAGSLDVLAQHIFAVACHGPFNAPSLYKEVKRAWPYKNLSEQDFFDAINLVKDGGYALRSYKRFSRLEPVEGQEGYYQLRSKKDARRYRMNVGTIVEAPLLKVMMKNRKLGVIEEYFILNLSIGDTFLFGGEVLRFEGIKDAIVKVSRTKDSQAQIPSYAGGRMPLSTHLSNTVRRMIGRPKSWNTWPDQIKSWLKLHNKQSVLPDEKSLVIETFPRAKKHYMVVYSFAGRNANDTMGFLAMRRMKHLGLRPLGFVTTDYALTIWSFKEAEDPEEIFKPELIYDDFEEWIYETPLMRRLFRDAAVISGLVERTHPGHTKTGRQVLVSTDLIFDVLMTYQKDHILLRSAYQDARHSLIDADRVKDLLLSVSGNIVHKKLDKVSPLAVPSILQVNRETLSKKDRDEAVFEDMEAEILNEAGVLSVED